MLLFKAYRTAISSVELLLTSLENSNLKKNSSMFSWYLSITFCKASRCFAIPFSGLPDACEDILTQLLPVLDNLERALTMKSNTDSLKTGIEMTIRIFNESLNKLGVEEVNYERFDPNVHEAIMVQNSNYLNSGDISTVYQKGYKRDNKLIRCAKVAVVKWDF